MLEIAGLTKSFAGFVAVADVSLTIETKQIAAVIGPNGAGKSTLFNLITGICGPTAAGSCSMAATSPACSRMRRAGWDWGVRFSAQTSFRS